MTSANVIEYTIFNKNGEEVGHHRQNMLCKTNNDGLEKFIPSSDFTIQPWGYDEEEEIWEGPIINLETWLNNHKPEISFKKNG